MDEKRILIQWLNDWSKFPDVPKLEDSHLQHIMYSTIGSVHAELERRIVQVEDHNGI